MSGSPRPAGQAGFSAYAGAPFGTLALGAAAALAQGSPLKRAITRGTGRDGRRLQEPMAFAWYANIRDEDLDAIVAYLRTLPPLPR